ncbi:OmpA family protein [Lysobacter sp. K5869]|uniref:OmpA family protein n=1 Tax=Lysobacter sp. K5869 TaxID=2820808 RepID=UPI001C0624D2|nr:OmpA family protein [Lysobacter sp. K5869]QWP79141.1 OmpA family protein [Lysobacter sp. K5869]
MTDNRAQLQPIVGTFLVLLLTACVNGSERLGKNGGLASGPDLPPVFFRSGLPASEGGLMDALDDRITDPSGALRNALQAANANSKVKLEIGGHADLEECETTDCYALSRRRAAAVHAWLVGHGISERALSAPKGYGHDRAIAADSTDSERRYNRRVEFSLVGPR